MSKKFDEIEKKFTIQETRSRALGSLVNATNSKVNRQESDIRILEDTLIKAGILVEIKTEPPVVTDVTIQREVWNPSPFRILATPSSYTRTETKNYKVVIPNQQKGATVGPRSEGSK